MGGAVLLSFSRNSESLLYEVGINSNLFYDTIYNLYVIFTVKKFHNSYKFFFCIRLGSNLWCAGNEKKKFFFSLFSFILLGQCSLFFFQVLDSTVSIFLTPISCLSTFSSIHLVLPCSVCIICKPSMAVSSHFLQNQCVPSPFLQEIYTLPGGLSYSLFVNK